MKFVFTITISIVFSSCLTSLHPITNAKNVIAEERVLGNWLCNEEDTIHIRRFKESEFYKPRLAPPMGRKSSIITEPPLTEDSILYARAYNVVFKKDGVQYSMFGAITRIGGQLFIDLIPIIAENPKNEKQSGFEYSTDYLPVFTMAKLEIKNHNQLNLHFLNGDFIKEQIKNGNIRINHESDNLFESLLITASTQQLHQFLEKYSHDQRLFSKENSVTLTRKG